MVVFLASLAALMAGPLSERFAKRRSGLSSGLDAFVLVSITGLIFGHVLPESAELAGWTAIAAAGIGLFLPRWFEGSIHKMALQAHMVALFLGVTGLFLHALLDGAALAGGHEGEGGVSDQVPTGLAIAVVLHRIPVGLTIWTLLRRSRGAAFASWMLIFMGVATAIGFAGGDALLEKASSYPRGLFQGLVAGSLLHVVWHPTGRTASTPKGIARFYPGLGGLLGIGLLLLLNHFESNGHGHAVSEHGGFGERFLALALVSAPALLVAFTVAGFVQMFLPKTSMERLARGSAWSQAIRGVAFGLPLPLCSCGVVPVYKSLAARRIPLGAGLAFLVATPELGLDAILISLPLLGVEMTIVRVIAAALVALAVGILAPRFFGRSASAEESEPSAVDADKVEETPKSWREALHIGLIGVFDATAPWIVLGLAVGALFSGDLTPDWLDSLPAMARVPLFALIGVPFYVCASAATPMIAALIAVGLSPGAALAFLLTGPATNVTTFGILSDLHGRRLAFGFGLVVFGATTLLGWTTDAILGPIDIGALTESGHQTSAIAAFALGALSLVFLASFLRRGPRDMMAQIFPWASVHDHDHDHGHGHGHDAETPSQKGHDKAPEAGGDGGCCH